MAPPKLPFAPLWVAPFRPFCALGMAYGVVLMALWLAWGAGLAPLPAGPFPPPLWHGHEMVFGFAAAIVCATVLTALPGWAGTRELRGGPLALLVLLWIAGRVAFWAADALPPAAVAAADGALYVALLAVLGVQLAAVANRWYRLVLVVLAAMLAGDLLFVGGARETGLALALHALVLLFALKAGVLTPVFTGNRLRATGRGDQAPFLPALEWAAIGTVALLALADVGHAPAGVRGSAALAAAAANAVRLARWRGWAARDDPLLWTMHVAYAWMIAAFLLHAAGDLGSAGAARAWVHAFTVGALGSMMLSLMTRVALRHTGRPLVVPAVMRVAYALIELAALARVGAALAGAGGPWVAASGLAWIAAFVLYLARFAAILASPSLPRAAASPLAAGTDAR